MKPSTPVLLQPFKFTPIMKRTLWGGTRIAAFKGLPANAGIGESWELSGVAGSESVCCGGGAADGSDVGQPLSAITARYGLLPAGSETFPLLIKFIDARADLSLQVHPDDTLARQRGGASGKTEMWYVLQADPGAKIYSGLCTPLTPEGYDAIAGTAQMESVIAAHESHAGDVFYLPAGRLHAIGAGNLLVEVQQTCDITYRVYDFGRVDADGQPRALHLAEARDAIDYRVHDDYRTRPEAGSDVLVQCPYFTVLRHVGPFALTAADYAVVICVKGSGHVADMPIAQGDTLLVPQQLLPAQVEGDAEVIVAISSIGN